MTRKGNASPAARFAGAKLIACAAAFLAICEPGMVFGEGVGDYLVCPECHTLNAIGAEHCVRCGASLRPEEEAPAVLRTVPFTVAPTAAYGYHRWGPGASCRGDAARWSYGLAYQFFPVSVHPYEGSLWSTEDDVHRLRALSVFYLGARKRVTPYLGAVLDGGYQHVASNHYGEYGVYEHEFAVAAEVTAGINLIYTTLGSNADLNLAIGPYTWWESGPGAGARTWRYATSFRAANVTFVIPHVGVWAEIIAGNNMHIGSGSSTVMAVGPAFGW